MALVQCPRCDTVVAAGTTQCPSCGLFFESEPTVAYVELPDREHPLTPDEAASVDGAEKKVALTDFRGKLVMLNFWASWCVPCREEMPQMERLYQEYKARGFVIVAVNVKDSRDDALAFVRELKFTYPALFDPEGEIGLLYGAWGLPTTYLIGPKGEGLARMWGPAKWDGAGAKQLIKDLLDGKR